MSDLHPVICKNCSGQMEIQPDKETVTCPYCGTEHIVADVLQESDAVRVEKLRIKAEKEKEALRIEQEKVQGEKQEKQNALDLFKKGKFSKVLIISAIVALLLTVIAFVGGSIISGIIGVLMTAGFIAAYLMGMQVIPEKRHNLRLIPTIVAFILIIPFLACLNTSGQSSEPKTWEDLLLADQIPTMDKKIENVWENSGRELRISLKKVMPKDYLAYVKACEAKGYTVDPMQEDWSYMAYDEQGYRLKVDYSDYSESLNLELKAPLPMKAIQWPENEIGKLLPKPTFEQGYMEDEDEKSFKLYVDGMTEQDYEDYINACKSKGFTEDYSTQDYSYWSYDANRNYVGITYEGNNIVCIDAHISYSSSDDSETVEDAADDEADPWEDVWKSVDEAVENIIPETSAKATTTNAPATTKPASNVLRPDFKNAMDKYEAFMDEYIAFMKKYQSAPGDLSLLADYGTYMAKYADAVSAFEQWESEDLNDAELAYYTKVQLRVAQKLYSVS